MISVGLQSSVPLLCPMLMRRLQSCCGVAALFERAESAAFGLLISSLVCSLFLELHPDYRRSLCSSGAYLLSFSRLSFLSLLVCVDALTAAVIGNDKHENGRKHLQGVLSRGTRAWKSWSWRWKR